MNCCCIAPFYKEFQRDPFSPIDLDQVWEINLKKIASLAAWLFFGFVITSIVVYNSVHFKNINQFYRYLGASFSVNSLIFMALARKHFLEWKKYESMAEQEKKTEKTILGIPRFTKKEKQNALENKESVVSINPCSVSVPGHIWQAIFLHLNIRDLRHVSQCCRNFRFWINQDFFWKSLCKKEFGEDLDKDFQKEYRQRISWRKQIFTHYVRLFKPDDFRFFLRLQEKLFLVKSHLLVTGNGSQVIGFPRNVRVDNVICTKSRVFLVCHHRINPIIEMYSTDFQRFSDIIIDAFSFPLIKKHKFSIVELSETLWVAIKNKIFIYTKDGQELGKKEFGDHVVVKDLLQFDQYLVCTAKNQDGEEIHIYSCDSSIKLVKTIKASEAQIGVFQENGKDFLIVAERNDTVREVSIFASNNLENPIESYFLPRRFVLNVVMSGKYVCYDNALVDMWFPGQKESVRSTLPYSEGNIKALNYKNFLVVASRVEIQVIDTHLQKKYYIKNYEKEQFFKQIDIIEGKLLVYTVLKNAKAIEVFDFGNFESAISIL